MVFFFNEKLALAVGLETTTFLLLHYLTFIVGY